VPPIPSEDKDNPNDNRWRENVAIEDMAKVAKFLREADPVPPEDEDNASDNRRHERVALLALAIGDKAKVAKYLREADPISPDVRREIAQIFHPIESERSRYVHGWKLEFKLLKTNQIARNIEKILIAQDVLKRMARGAPRKVAVEDAAKQFDIKKSKTEQALAFLRDCHMAMRIVWFVRLELVEQGFPRGQSVEKAAQHCGMDVGQFFIAVAELGELLDYFPLSDFAIPPELLE
jgi:hypothetical protein